MSNQQDEFEEASDSELLDDETETEWVGEEEWGDEEEKMSDQQILDSEFFYVYENDDNLFNAIKYKLMRKYANNF